MMLKLSSHFSCFNTAAAAAAAPQNVMLLVAVKSGFAMSQFGERAAAGCLDLRLLPHSCLNSFLLID